MPLAKTKSQNVLRSFLTQEMVYTVNLMLLEYGSIDTVQFTGRFQIITERLLDDDTRMRTVQAGSLEMKRNHTIQRRRRCQIVQHAIRLLLTRQFPETGIQISIIGSLGRIKRKIVQMIAKNQSYVRRHVLPKPQNVPFPSVYKHGRYHPGIRYVRCLKQQNLPAGGYPCTDLYNAGINLRFVRSPEAPKIIITNLLIALCL